jgi:hypothetical protein
MPPVFVFNAPGSGTPPVTTKTFTMGAGVLALDHVAVGAVADTAVRANADSFATGRSIGVVTSINDPVVGQCQVLLPGDIAAGFAGLVPGATYVLQSVANGGVAGGMIISTATATPGYPDTTPGSGEILQPVGVAKSATELVLTADQGFTQF